MYLSVANVAAVKTLMSFTVAKVAAVKSTEKES